MSIAATNLTSVPVLVFLLGLIAAQFKSDITIPEPVYHVISIYLLFGIGLKGGVALQNSELGDVAVPVLATIGLGIVIPLLAFALLRITKLSSLDRGAIAAHYGSTSLVTFSAALVFLETNKIFYEGFATTLLTVMEIPGIVVGILLGSLGLKQHMSWAASLREILMGKTVVLLVGGLVIGFISGSTGYQKVTPFFVDLLPGILALFLMHLGYLAGRRLSLIREAGVGLLAFALVFPLLAGSLGVVTGTAIGLSVGGAMVLGILSASASYIAAPAAVAIALPKANASLAITASLGMTFPFNLIVGIPVLYQLASHL